MEYCKHCSKPILSDLENQVYCSSECWRESKAVLKNEEDIKPIETESALYVWSSIISMLSKGVQLLVTMLLHLQLYILYYGEYDVVIFFHDMCNLRLEL